MGLGLVFGLLIDGALIGVIIAFMQRGEFPGWGPSIGSALAIGVTSSVVGYFLPGLLSLLGIVAGAAVGAFVISWLCGMSLERGAKAAGIYLGVRFAFSLLWMLLAAI